MSSSAPAPMKEYLLILPDHANALDKRLAVRATHFQNLTPCVDAGQVVLGGATLARHPAAGQPPDMNGSAVLIRAESEEQVWAWVKNDVYATAGVWDLDKVQVIPFRCAVRTAM